MMLAVRSTEADDARLQVIEPGEAVRCCLRDLLL